MKMFTEVPKVFLYRDFVDFRKSINGLSLIVEPQMQLSPLNGIELSRKTMANWMIKCADLFKPLYTELQKILLQQGVIQADETTLKVINEDEVKSYIWLYCTGTDSQHNGNIPNIVLYDYQAGWLLGTRTPKIY